MQFLEVLKKVSFISCLSSSLQLAMLTAIDDLALSFSPLQWEGSGDNFYDPYDSSTYTQRHRLYISFDDADGDRVFISFNPGLHASSEYNRRLESSGSYLSYQVYKNNGATNILQEPPSRNANAVTANIRSSNSSPLRRNMFLRIPSGQVVPPGTYTDTLTLNLYTGRPNRSYSFEVGPYSLTITAQVPASLFLSLVDTGQGYDENSQTKNINFGSLYQGQEKDLDLLVKGNSPYIVQMTSSNQSELVNPSVNSTVSYSLSVGGQSKNLSAGPVDVVTQNSLPSAQGDRYHCVFTIGSIAQAFPAQYEDQITVSIIAN